MEKLKWTTPIKNGNEYENLTIKSPVIYKTPVKQCETNSKRTTYQSNISSFSVLPNHITPPSGLTKFMARNPFETDLTSRLHLSVISPTVFSKVSSPSQQSSNFEWSVDELALIQPAKIEEFPIQQIHCIDTETEIKAQAAIDQFFNENEIIPSPWETKRKEIRTKIEVNTPVRSSPDLNLDSSNSKKDGWSQTMLTFAPELPSHVMEILKPYFTFVQNQNIESDDANSSNNSLRRKLFFNHEDCVDNDESSICVSPVKMNGSLLLSSSPPQSGMLIHGAPKSYEIKNIFVLMDEEYKPSGYINIFLRLTCFGTHTINPFVIVGKRLLYRNIGSFNEFLCTKVMYPDEEERRAAEAGAKFCMPEKIFEESELDTPPRPINIASLILVCKELSQRDGYPPNVISPNYPPKIPEITIEEIKFDINRIRRKGFEMLVEEEIHAITPRYKTCINIGCPGNICTGQK